MKLFFSLRSRALARGSARARARSPVVVSANSGHRGVSARDPRDKKCEIGKIYMGKIENLDNEISLLASRGDRGATGHKRAGPTGYGGCLYS